MSELLLHESPSFVKLYSYFFEKSHFFGKKRKRKDIIFPLIDLDNLCSNHELSSPVYWISITSKNNSISTTRLPLFNPFSKLTFGLLIFQAPWQLEPFGNSEQLVQAYSSFRTTVRRAGSPAGFVSQTPFGLLILQDFVTLWEKSEPRGWVSQSPFGLLILQDIRFLRTRSKDKICLTRLSAYSSFRTWIIV